MCAPVMGQMAALEALKGNILAGLAGTVPNTYSIIQSIIQFPTACDQYF
ncbi:hypothetical protein [Candidatus Contubernalis alkaliaceticus]|nr:hypothetical protein [Candidatus Contubernalis alkalaceticus]UNC91339.1 hypothetical protein HUE98_04080 [Candidatus Contubernalis alkalaceticus]